MLQGAQPPIIITGFTIKAMLSFVSIHVLLGECHLTPTQLLGHKRRHERPGIEALLHKQAKEKKQGTTTRPLGVSTLRCTYSPGGNRCTEKVLPLTKHCMKRILYISVCALNAVPAKVCMG